MILIDELISDYKDIEKAMEGKNPFSPKEEEQCSVADYTLLINAKTKIAETLLSCGVIGIEDVPPFRALEMAEKPTRPATEVGPVEVSE